MMSLGWSFLQGTASKSGAFIAAAPSAWLKFVKIQSLPESEEESGVRTTRRSDFVLMSSQQTWLQTLHGDGLAETGTALFVEHFDFHRQRLAQSKFSFLPSLSISH